MIRVQNLWVQAGAFALKGVSLEIPTGQCGVLMGKTGSGKTTVLEAICGLRRIEHGEVRLMDQDVTNLRPADRGIGYVPQDGALFSTMTIRDHLAFALNVRKRPREEIDRRVGELASMLALEPLLARRPEGLSGGEAQRVALGRALAAGPGILLMDEPLSALDDETREDMYGLLESVRKATGVTALHVTHSRAEARRLADKIFILAGGQVREVSLAEIEL